MSLKRSSSVRLKKFVLASVLAAVILLMWLVPFIGYIKVGVIEITLLMIPVAVGAITLGPMYGAILGGVFGLTSVLMAFLGVPSPSAFGTALVGINPWFAVILFMIPRILMGWLCGLIFKLLAKIDKTRIVSYIVASLAGALLNTVLFMTALVLLFGTTYLADNFGDAVVIAAMTVVSLNVVLEAAACTVIGTAVSKALSKIKY